MTQTIAIRRMKGVNVDAFAAAINTQVKQHLAPAWGINPDAYQVVAYSPPKHRDWWRVQFYNHLPPGEGGVHLNTRSGQPFAQVLASEGSVACSHEILEMVVDPVGERFTWVGDREYLVEVCDPCETDTYLIGGVEVSDFITPSWYSLLTKSNRDYLNRIHIETGLRPNSYCSWVTGHDWYQAFSDASGHVDVERVGAAKLKTRAEKDILVAGVGR